MIKEEKLQFIDENSTGMKLKRGVVKLYRMEPEGREITVALPGSRGHIWRHICL